MGISSIVAVVAAVGVMTLSAPHSFADAPVAISVHAQSQSESSSTTSGQYSLQVTFSDYENQVVGTKTGKTLTIKTEAPPKPCTATDFAGTPEKLFRTFDAQGCQILEGGKTLAFRGKDGDFALVMVEGKGKARHVVVRDSAGAVMWERFGSAAYFVRAGGFRCKTTVTNSAHSNEKQEFIGRCFSFIGRDISNGVMMISDSGAELLIDVTNNK